MTTTSSEVFPLTSIPAESCNTSTNSAQSLNITAMPLQTPSFSNTNSMEVPPSPSIPSTQNNSTSTSTSNSTAQHQTIDKSTANYILKTGLAGGLAGSTAKTLIAPLDRVKILFQTSNPVYAKYSGSLFGLFRASHRIYFTDGLAGFYQGHSATLLRIFPYAAIKFVAYEQIRNILIPNQNYETSIRRLLSGSMAGLCSVFITYPLDLIRVRLAYETRKFNSKIIPIKHHDHYHNFKQGRLVTTVREIYRETPRVTKEIHIVGFLKRTLPESISNLTNFYRGFIPTVMGMIPYAGVSFWTHDFIHDLLRMPVLAPVTTMQISSNGSSSQDSHTSSHRVPLRTWAQLLAGGVSGMFSQTAAYPFEVIRRRMQVGGVNHGEYLSISKISKEIFKEKGFRGFYVGLSIGYIKVIPMTACSFYVYERCKYYLGV
ncbi:hypothetical protein WICPIJ_002597 [Wickerhamomyces pijperi]|uniref:Mitochondrial carrier protein LEU5 n=1 Tax=Wickerhamomyces pijperi TaxID=599730 RepID=A0A9P8TNT1_WICPI|nr:hypothetical protein WICPIJ_002597 [Wickerhamomyces pijperi]